MAEAKQDIQDIGQLVAEADGLVVELRERLEQVVQSASDDGPQVELQEWFPPSVEPPAAPDASPADEEQPTDAAPEASAVPEASADPEALAEPEAPAEPTPSESVTSETAVSESAEPDEPTAPTEPLAEDVTETTEQPSILVSTGESEQITPSPDEAVLGTEEDAVVDSGEGPSDSGSEPEAVEATNEPEDEPDKVMVDEKEEAPSVESELLVDATAEVGDTAEAQERVRSLDSELARLADSMMEGEVDDEQSVLVEGGNESLPDKAGSKPADAVPAAAPEDVPVSASSEPDPVAVADGPGGGVLYHLRRALSAACPGLTRLVPTLVGEFGPTARVLCQRASGPVNKRPPVVRRAVGCVAIVTAMYAVAVLVYVAVLRKPPTIDALNTGTTLVSGSGEAVASRRDD